jgi:hypothetical protein
VLVSSWWKEVSWVEGWKGWAGKPQEGFQRRLMRYSSLKRHSFLGTAGQTLDDMYKYLPSDDRLGMARRTLEWRHIAPTAPDTLCELRVWVANVSFRVRNLTIGKNLFQSFPSLPQGAIHSLTRTHSSLNNDHPSTLSVISRPSPRH